MVVVSKQNKRYNTLYKRNILLSYINWTKTVIGDFQLNGHIKNKNIYGYLSEFSYRMRMDIITDYNIDYYIIKPFIIPRGSLFIFI